MTSCWYFPGPSILVFHSVPPHGQGSCFHFPKRPEPRWSKRPKGEDTKKQQPKKGKAQGHVRPKPAKGPSEESTEEATQGEQGYTPCLYSTQKRLWGQALPKSPKMDPAQAPTKSIE